MNPFYQLRHVLIELSYKPALEEMGLRVVGRHPLSSCAVLTCELDGHMVIAKLTPTRAELATSILRREKEILTKLAGCNGVPYFIGYYEEVPAAYFSAVTNLVRFGNFQRDTLNILIRAYISGRTLRKGEKIMEPLQQRVLGEIVDSCHKEGYAGLEHANPRNVLIDSNSHLYFVDLGARVHRDESPEEFQRLVREDLTTLEHVCGK